MQRLVLLCACVVLALSVSASAGVVELGFNTEFSGAWPPSGPPDWLTATFDDDDTPGSVQLTLDTTGLTGGEFVGEWYFNLDPALDPDALSFTKVASVGTFDDPTLSTGVDSFLADGTGGRHDILLDFGNGPASKRFGVGESVTYDITGISSLMATSFDTGSAGAGLPSAAHVQGIDPDGENSGWVTVPGPAPLGLLAVGAIGLRRRRRP